MMKIKSYILILMLLSLLSCAEEGPFTMGKMECKVEVSMVLPTSAIVSVTIPPGEDNIIGDWDRPRINLSDRPLNSSEDFWNAVHFTFMEKYLSEEDHTFNFFVYDLKPNTTYYVVLNAPMHISDDHNNALYYTASSFTTAPEGDYSVLGGRITAELDFMGNNFSVFRLNQSGLSEIGYLSGSGDLTWSYGADMAESNDGRYTFSGSVGYVYIPHRFEKDDNIKFNFSGRFNLPDGTSPRLSFSTEYTVGSSQQLVSNPECVTLFTGQDYTLVETKYPDEFSSMYLSYAVSENKDFSKPINISSYKKFLLLGRDVNHNVDNYVRAKGDFGINKIQVKEGIIDLTGKVDAAVDGKRVFEINEEWSLADLIVKVRCPEGFSFSEPTYGSDETRLTIYYGSDRKLSEVISKFSSQELEFKISSKNISQLQRGEMYIMRLSYFILNYNDQQVAANGTLFDLDWVFPENID